MKTIHAICITLALLAGPSYSAAEDCRPWIVTDQIIISGVQTVLKNQGYDVGPVDGRKGPRTMLALEHYRSKHGQRLTGELDRITAFLLLTSPTYGD